MNRWYGILLAVFLLFMPSCGGPDPAAALLLLKTVIMSYVLLYGLVVVLLIVFGDAVVDWFTGIMRIFVPRTVIIILQRLILLIGAFLLGAVTMALFAGANIFGGVLSLVILIAFSRIAADYIAALERDDKEERRTLFGKLRGLLFAEGVLIGIALILTPGNLRYLIRLF